MRLPGLPSLTVVWHLPEEATLLERICARPLLSGVLVWRLKPEPRGGPLIWPCPARAFGLGFALCLVVGTGCHQDP